MIERVYDLKSIWLKECLIGMVYDWKSVRLEESVRLKESKIGEVQDWKIVYMCDFKFSGFIA